MSKHDLVGMIHPRDLDPRTLLTSAIELLWHPPANRPTLPMDGLTNVVHELEILSAKTAALIAFAPAHIVCDSET